MKIAPILYAPLMLLLAVSLPTVVKAENENWVYLGDFGNNLFQAWYDAAGARTERNVDGDIVAYVKFKSVSHAAIARFGLDSNASYHTENFGVNCASRTVREWASYFT